MSKRSKKTGLEAWIEALTSNMAVLYLNTSAMSLLAFDMTTSWAATACLHLEKGGR